VSELAERDATPSSADEALRPFAEALAADIGLLASLHDRELTAEVAEAARACSIAEQLALTLASPAGRTAVAAFDEALKELPVTLDAEVIDELAAQYADVYLRHTYRVAPSESVWLTEDGLERQEPMFKAEHWYRRHNLKVDDWAQRPADHLVIELRFLAYLASEAKDKDGLADLARFLDEHPLRWLERFAATLAKYHGPPLYRALASLTAAYLDEAREYLADITGVARPVAQVEPAKSKAAPEKTCADPDDRPYMPGVAPSW
jgi:TorA maturation chaperone TorD